MKKITQMIREINIFPVQPWLSEQMNQVYPFMHNLFIDPLIYSVDLHNNHKHTLIVMGQSDYADDNLQNSVFYAGAMGKHSCPNYPWHECEQIVFLNYIPNASIKEAENGMLAVQLPGKDLRYLHNKEIQSTPVNLLMIYFNDEGAGRDTLLHDTVLALQGCRDTTLYHSRFMKELFARNPEHSTLVRSILDEDYRNVKEAFWKVLYPEIRRINDLFDEEYLKELDPNLVA